MFSEVDMPLRFLPAAGEPWLSLGLPQATAFFILDGFSRTRLMR